MIQDKSHVETDSIRELNNHETYSSGRLLVNLRIEQKSDSHRDTIPELSYTKTYSATVYVSI